MGTQLLRIFFLLLMALTGGAKLLDMPGFVAVVASYQSLPSLITAPSAWMLALTEIGFALWLASGKQMRLAAIALIAMHLLYLAWQLIALARGLHLPNCGCFGVYWVRPLNWFSPLEDVVLLVLAVLFLRGTHAATVRN